jgi:hypothetical protein
LGWAQARIAEQTADAALAASGLQKLREGEALLRDGGHCVWADEAAQSIPAAEAIVARLSR